MSVCVNHPDRAGTARCMCCHKPICNVCVVEDSGKTFCSQTCIENTARFRNFRPVRGPGFFGRLWGLIVSLGGLVLIAGILLAIGAKVLKIDFCINLLKKIGL